MGWPEVENHRAPDGTLYLRRWVIWRSNKTRRAIYLHHFVNSDWSPHLHDHPKAFISIGLKGAYVEETEGSWNLSNFKLWRAPWFRWFPASHRHRIIVPPMFTAWSLCLVGKAEYPWGFYTEDGWIEWDMYEEMTGRT